MKGFVLFLFGCMAIVLTGCSTADTTGSTTAREYDVKITNSGGSTLNIYTPATITASTSGETDQSPSNSSAVDANANASLAGQGATSSVAAEGAEMLLDGITSSLQQRQEIKDRQEEAARPIKTDTGPEDTGVSEKPPVSDAKTIKGTGVVWKPVAENDGKLVVLIPKRYSNVGVTILPPAGGNGMVVRGKFVGRTNGDRPTYRFTLPGGGYPKNSRLKIGTTSYLVPDPAKRYN